MAYAILRAEKLKTAGNIGGSLAHTYRTRETPNADDSRTPDNQVLIGADPDEVKAAIAGRLPAKRRSDAVLAIEYFVGASPDAYDNAGGGDYFADALKWLQDRHGAENVVSAVIHRDETSPHMSALVVPRDGDKLNAKKWLGGKATLSAMQTDFAERVGKAHGLERGIEGSRSRHTSIKQWYAGIERANKAAPQITAERLAGELTPRRKKGAATGVKKALGIEPKESRAEAVERVAGDINAALARVAAGAANVAQERKKRREAEATAKAKAAELAAVRPVLDATAGLTPAEVAEAVGAWKIQQRAAMLAKAVAERVDKLARVAVAGGDGILQRFARWCMKASAAKSGDVAKVDWPAVEKAWADAPETLQAHKHASIAKTLIEHGPSHAGTTPAAQAKLLQEAQRLDKIDALKAGKKASRGHGFGM